MTTKTETHTLSRLKKRLKHFRRKNRYADEFEAANMIHVADNLRACQQSETLVVCSSCRSRWYVETRCRLRVCPLCSWEESRDRADFILAMTHQMKHPKLLTVTIPRIKGDPQTGIKYIRACWNKLRRSKSFAQVRGGAYQIELKPKADGWHIHIHAILDSPFLPYQHIFTAWKHITRVDAPQVDIRAADSKEARSYACKYAAKSAAFDTAPGLIVQWYLATRGQRLFSTFGQWYNASPKDFPQLHQDEPPQVKCPYCGALNTSFYARDGPYVIGWEIWRDHHESYTGGLPLLKPMPEADQLLNEEHAA